MIPLGLRLQYDFNTSHTYPALRWADFNSYRVLGAITIGTEASAEKYLKGCLRHTRGKKKQHMTLSFVHDTSPLKVEVMRLFLTLKNMKYLVGEREHMETVLVLQFSRTQHIKCCEFLCTTACGFPAVGMLLCLLYFRVSLKPPLWPNTTTVHCWCKICPTDHSTTEACLLSSTAISNPRSLLWIFVTVFAPFPSLASFLFPPVSQILRGTRD